MIEQMHIAIQKWQEIKDDEDIDEETRKSFMLHGRFIACILEKKNMVTIPHAILIIIQNFLNNSNQIDFYVEYKNANLFKSLEFYSKLNTK